MKATLRKLPRTAKMYLVYTFLSTLYFAWPVFIAYLSGRNGIEAVGIFFTVNSLASLIAEVPTGYIADRFGRKASVVSGLFLKILGVAALVSGTSITSLIVFAVLYGIGLALVSGALEALLYQSVTHEEYEQTMSLSVPFYQTGLVLSAFTGGLLYEIHRQLPLLAEAARFGLMFIPVLLMAKDTHQARGELSYREALSSLKKIVSMRESLSFLAVYVAYATVLYVFVDMILEKKMIELAITPGSRGMLIAGIKIIAIIAMQTYVMGKLKSVRAKALCAFASGIIAFTVIGFTQQTAFFVLIYLFTNPFTMLLDAAMNPIMQKLSRHETRATDLSMYSLLSRLAFAGSAPLVAWYMAGHSTAGIYFVSAGALILTIPLLLRTLKWYEMTADS